METRTCGICLCHAQHCTCLRGLARLVDWLVHRFAANRPARTGGTLSAGPF